MAPYGTPTKEEPYAHKIIATVPWHRQIASHWNSGQLSILTDILEYYQFCIHFFSSSFSKKIVTNDDPPLQPQAIPLSAFLRPSKTIMENVTVPIFQS
jgi:hypothetical protein